MKNILFVLSFLLSVSIGTAQVKVFSDGSIKAGLTSTTNLYGSTFEVRKDVNGRAGQTISNLNNSTLSRVGLDLTAGSSNDRFSINMFGQNYTGALNGIPLAGWGRFQSSFTASGFMFNAASPTQSLVFMTGNIERFRINAGGNVGVGYTTPAHKLHVNGDVVANNVSASSDKRLKKNISRLDYGLKEVLQLEPVKFQYNGKGQIEDTETMQYGLIAQDVQKIFPELVKSYEMTEYSTPLSKSIDNPSYRREDYASQAEYLLIRDSQIKFALINAVKEQHEIIEEQQNQIDYLKDQVTELFSLIENGEDVSSEKVSLENLDSKIYQNTPNPFNNNTNIEFVIPASVQTAKINFYNMNGAVIKSQTISTRGQGTLDLDANDLPSGTYSYALEVDGKVVKALKMVVLK